MNSDNLLACLIKERLVALGLSEHELVDRLGYENIGKGLNRLRQLYAGDFSGAQHFLANLAGVLETDQAAIDKAHQETLELEKGRRIREYELNFKPHAVCLTQHRIPTQIFIAGMIGADRKRYIYFEPSADPTSFREIALNRLPKAIPTFGGVVGFVVNYSLDHAVEYDLQGSVVEVRNRALWVGRIELKGL